MALPATQVFHEDSFSQSQDQFRAPPTVKQIGSLEIDGNSYKVMTGMNKIGRHPKCKIVINHETVSKEHAEIEAYEGEGSTFIRDLKSSNKTKVNNVTLKTDRSYQLNDRATLTFGKVHAVYRIYVRRDEDISQNVLSPSKESHKNLPNNIEKLADERNEDEGSNENCQCHDQSNNDSNLLQLSFSQECIFDDSINEEGRRAIGSPDILENYQQSNLDIQEIPTQEILYPDDKNIYNTKTQEPTKNISELETRSLENPKEKNSIFEAETQKENGIFDAETQKSVPENAKNAEQENLNSKSSIHEMETQVPISAIENENIHNSETGKIAIPPSESSEALLQLPKENSNDSETDEEIVFGAQAREINSAEAQKNLEIENEKNLGSEVLDKNIHEMDTQVPDSENTDEYKSEIEKSVNPPNESSDDSETDEENIFAPKMPEINSAKAQENLEIEKAENLSSIISEKNIHEMETQIPNRDEFQLGAEKSVNPPNKNSDDSETDEESIFAPKKREINSTGAQENLDPKSPEQNIHEMETQIPDLEVENPKEIKSGTPKIVNPSNENSENSETDEENIFAPKTRQINSTGAQENLDQKIPEKNIHEMETQILDLEVENTKEIKSGTQKIVNPSNENSENSETDEENIFAPKKREINSTGAQENLDPKSPEQNIHEMETQIPDLEVENPKEIKSGTPKIVNPSNENSENSETDEENIFAPKTREINSTGAQENLDPKIPQKNIHEMETQIPDLEVENTKEFKSGTQKIVSPSNENSENFETDDDNIFAPKTREINSVAVQENLEIEKEENLSSKIPEKNIHEMETQIPDREEFKSGAERSVNPSNQNSDDSETDEENIFATQMCESNSGKNIREMEAHIRCPEVENRNEFKSGTGEISEKNLNSPNGNVNDSETDEDNIFSTQIPENPDKSRNQIIEDSDDTDEEGVFQRYVYPNPLEAPVQALDTQDVWGGPEISRKDNTIINDSDDEEIIDETAEIVDTTADKSSPNIFEAIAEDSFLIPATPRHKNPTVNDNCTFKGNEKLNDTEKRNSESEKINGSEIIENLQFKKIVTLHSQEIEINCKEISGVHQDQEDTKIEKLGPQEIATLSEDSVEKMEEDLEIAESGNNSNCRVNDFEKLKEISRTSGNYEICTEVPENSKPPTESLKEPATSSPKNLKNSSENTQIEIVLNLANETVENFSEGSENPKTSTESLRKPETSYAENLEDSSENIKTEIVPHSTIKIDENSYAHIQSASDSNLEYENHENSEIPKISTEDPKKIEIPSSEAGKNSSSNFETEIDTKSVTEHSSEKVETQISQDFHFKSGKESSKNSENGKNLQENSNWSPEGDLKDDKVTKFVEESRTGRNPSREYDKNSSGALEADETTGNKLSKEKNQILATDCDDLAPTQLVNFEQPLNEFKIEQEANLAETQIINTETQVRENVNFENEKITEDHDEDLIPTQIVNFESPTKGNRNEDLIPTQIVNFESPWKRNRNEDLIPTQIMNFQSGSGKTSQDQDQDQDLIPTQILEFENQERKKSIPGTPNFQKLGDVEIEQCQNQNPLPDPKSIPETLKKNSKSSETKKNLEINSNQKKIVSQDPEDSKINEKQELEASCSKEIEEPPKIVRRGTLRVKNVPDLNKEFEIEFEIGGKRGNPKPKAAKGRVSKRLGKSVEKIPEEDGEKNVEMGKVTSGAKVANLNDSLERNLAVIFENSQNNQDANNVANESLISSTQKLEDILESTQQETEDLPRSVENYEYETSSTQLLEDNLKEGNLRKEKVEENMQKRGGKAKQRKDKGATVNLNDTIERNLHDIFEDVNEIPPQEENRYEFSTQSLEHVLEQTQMEETSKSDIEKNEDSPVFTKKFNRNRRNAKTTNRNKTENQLENKTNSGNRQILVVDITSPSPEKGKKVEENIKVQNSIPSTSNSNNNNNNDNDNDDDDDEIGFKANFDNSPSLASKKSRKRQNRSSAMKPLGPKARELASLSSLTNSSREEQVRSHNSFDADFESDSEKFERFQRDQSEIPNGGVENSKDPGNRWNKRRMNFLQKLEENGNSCIAEITGKNAKLQKSREKIEHFDKIDDGKFGNFVGAGLESDSDKFHRHLRGDENEVPDGRVRNYPGENSNENSKIWNHRRMGFLEKSEEIGSWDIENTGEKSKLEESSGKIEFFEKSAQEKFRNNRIGGILKEFNHRSRISVSRNPGVPGEIEIQETDIPERPESVAGNFESASNDRQNSVVSGEETSVPEKASNILEKLGNVENPQTLDSNAIGSRSEPEDHKKGEEPTGGVSKPWLQIVDDDEFLAGLPEFKITHVAGSPSGSSTSSRFESEFDFQARKQNPQRSIFVFEDKEKIENEKKRKSRMSRIQSLLNRKKRGSKRNRGNFGKTNSEDSESDYDHDFARLCELTRRLCSVKSVYNPPMDFETEAKIESQRDTKVRSQRGKKCKLEIGEKCDDSVSKKGRKRNAEISRPSEPAGIKLEVESDSGNRETGTGMHFAPGHEHDMRKILRICLRRIDDDTPFVFQVKKEGNLAKEEGKVPIQSESREISKKVPVLRVSKRATKRTDSEEQVSPPKRAKKSSSETIEVYLKPKPEEISLPTGRKKNAGRQRVEESTSFAPASSESQEIETILERGSTVTRSRGLEARGSSDETKRMETFAEKIFASTEPKVKKQNSKISRIAEAESTPTSSQNSSNATMSPALGENVLRKKGKPKKKGSLPQNEILTSSDTDEISLPRTSSQTSTSSSALEETGVVGGKRRGRKPLKSADPAKIDVSSELESSSILERSVRSSGRIRSSPNLDASGSENTSSGIRGKRSNKRKIASEESQESSNSSIGEEVKGRQQPKRSRVANSASLENLSIGSNSSLKSGKGARTPVRSRKSLPCPDRQVVLFTGVNSGDYQTQLDQVGAFETEDPKKSSILVTDKIRRTYKFLCALCMGIPIVSVEWLVESAQARSLLNWENFLLKDPAAEAKFGFKLKKSLEKAQSGKVLDGFTVVITPNITIPPIAELKNIIPAAGGKVLLRPPANWATENIVILTKENDLANARKFLAKAPKSATIQDVEFILTGIIRQELDFEKFRLQ